MNRDQAVSQVQLILGKRTDLTNEIISQLQFAQSELERRLELPFFLREETLTHHNTINQERMSLPSGFLREWHEDALWVFDDEADANSSNPWIPLVKDSPKFLRQAVIPDPTKRSRPVAYAYDGNGSNFMLFPTPDEVYTFRMIYYKAGQTLENNVENRWLKNIPYLLIGMAGAVIAGGIRDKGALEIFANLVAEGNDRLNKLTVATDGAGRRYVMGGED